MVVKSGVTATLENLTITGGSFGGGIDNLGTLTLTGCTVSGNTADIGGGIDNDTGGTLTMTDCTVAGNSAAEGGGIDNGIRGTLTMTDCTVSGNTATAGGFGGGIDNATGTLTLTDSTVSGNTAGAGGGIANRGGGAVMINCTVSGNMATTGGGIWNGGTLTLTNCTVVSNTGGKNLSPCYGGGIYNNGGTPTLTNCTLVGNGSVVGKGGDILNLAGNFTLNNSIVAYSQTTGGDIAGTVSGNNNLIDDAAAAGGLTGANGNILAEPLVGAALKNNGGPTQTLALLPGSPAINAGDNSLIPAGITTDQRGAPRINGGTVDIGAVESGPTTIVVSTLADEDNGGIDPALGSGTSLREAINFANADYYTGDTITFTAVVTGTLALSNALPAITANTTIDGPGAGVLTIDGQGASGIPSINARSSGILSIESGANAHRLRADAGQRQSQSHLLQ